MTELRRVQRAAETKRRADESYRSALVAAHAAGHSYAELARVAGVSRQAVRQLLLRRQ